MLFIMLALKYMFTLKRKHKNDKQIFIKKIFYDNKKHYKYRK